MTRSRRSEVPITLAYGSAPDQIADLYVPATDTPAPVAVLVHGGFWRKSFSRDLMDPIARDLQGRGWFAWNVDTAVSAPAGAGRRPPRTWKRLWITSPGSMTLDSTSEVLSRSATRQEVTSRSPLLRAGERDRQQSPSPASCLLPRSAISSSPPDSISGTALYPRSWADHLPRSRPTMKKPPRACTFRFGSRTCTSTATSTSVSPLA